MLKLTSRRCVRAAAPLTALLGLGAFLTESAHAAPLFIPVYSTGQSTVYSAGTQAQYSSGTTDTHWTVDSTTAKATITNPNTAWVANDGNSQWLSNVANSNSSLATDLSTAGSHYFQTTFVMPTNVILSTATISFNFAADNALTSVSVNGTAVTGVGGASGTAAGGGFSSFSSATLSSSNGANFSSGTNTLTFVVQNDGTTPNPMGLRVQFTNATVSAAAPEPASLAFVALGGLPTVGLIARRRRKKA